MIGKTSKAFGFNLEPLRIDAGPIRIEPLPQIEEDTREVFARDQVDNDWKFTPPQGVQDLIVVHSADRISLG